MSCLKCILYENEFVKSICTEKTRIVTKKAPYGQPHLLQEGVLQGAYDFLTIIQHSGLMCL